MKILVVGGAGYIGSHCVKLLQKLKYEPVVLDNLTSGHKASLPRGVPFYEENFGNRERVKTILQRENIELVVHFGASIFVNESVSNPIKYYRNNLAATIELLQAMLEANVKQLVFSSSCAIYGNPQTLPIAEEVLQSPINPYGQTKQGVENLLEALAHAHGLSFAAFRYFNAAGAAEDASIGEDHEPETHLLPLVFETLLKKRKNISIYGTDYDTPDGTCLRDYIHVDDIARAHILVFDKLKHPATALYYNLGTGKPYSVREAITIIENVTGQKIPTLETHRRPGDAAVLYADPSKAIKELGWELEYPTLEPIVKTAWQWHRQNPEGFASQVWRLSQTQGIR